MTTVTKRILEVTFLTWAISFGLSNSCWSQQPDTLQSSVALDGYAQQLNVEFVDESMAAQAQFAIEPLHDGHYRAVSCRWDDNGTSDNLPARKVMEDFGIRGTWYLNAREFSPLGEKTNYLPVARKLLEGGNSIGGHSLTHPYLTYFHANRMFAETCGVRIDWEAGLDQPVTSYAYSFVDLRPEPEGREVLIRTLESLKRAGFYHLSEFVNFFDDIDLTMELSPIMPPENRPLAEFKQAVKWGYGDQTLTKKWPMISNSMHAWYGTPRLNYELDELRRRFEILKKLENVWHCNQNQYAAYRRQFRQARLEQITRDGRNVSLWIRNRPGMIQLNDATPLTVSVTGVQAQGIVRASCASATVKLSDRQANDRSYLQVGHDRTQMLPTKIGHVSNPENSTEPAEADADGDFPRIRGGLWCEGNRIRLRISNGGSYPLENVRVAWRAPIGWDMTNPIEQLSGSVDTILSLSKAVTPTQRAEDRFGTAHYAAQVDFQTNGVPGRIHFTCQQVGATPNDSWPKEGFSLLGPIPNESFDVATVAGKIRTDGIPSQWELPDGQLLGWRPNAQDGYVTQDWLGPEYVRTMGTWDAYSRSYLLASRVVSPTVRQVMITVSHAAESMVMLNGNPVEEKPGKLKAGENELLIIYPGTSMSPATPRLTACFVRMSDPTSNRRLTDIRFRPYEHSPFRANE